MLFHMRAHSHHFPGIPRFMATPRLTFLAVGLAATLIFANASNWVVDKAPANESLALLFVVLVEGRLEFLLVTDIVLHDVLRHLVLGENLHQNVLLYEVGAEDVNIPCSGLVEENESHFIGHILEMGSNGIAEHIAYVELIFHPNYVDPLTYGSNAIQRGLSDFVRQYLHVQ